MDFALGCHIVYLYIEMDFFVIYCNSFHNFLLAFEQ